MANIPTLPSGRNIATATGTLSGTYGPHCTVAVVAEGAALARKNDGVVLAVVPVTGRFTVQLSLLDPETVPYVNSFLKGTGFSVLKNWRTGEYRFKREGSVEHTPVSNYVAPTKAKATPVVLEEDVETLAKGAVITVSAESRSKLSAIPGVEFPAKGSLKGAGRNWTEVGGIVIETEGFKTLVDAFGIAQDGDPSAVLLTGPAGTAKTMLVRAFAGHLGVPYLKVDAGSVRTADDWAGAFRQDPNTKTWAHRWSPFAQVLRAGEPCIVHIDELTRTETPAALNALMGLLDETGTLLVPDANAVLRMPKGILVVATANIGPEFVGTLPLDGAVRQRFPYGIRMAPPPEAQEAKLLVRRMGITADIADRLVRMAVQQRQHRDDAQLYPSGAIISTRVLLSIAKRIGRGADPRSAVISTLHAQFDPGDDAALSVVIDSQFPKGVDLTKLASPVVDASIVSERHYFVAPSHNLTVDCAWTFSDGSQCLRQAADPVHLR